MFLFLKNDILTEKVSIGRCGDCVYRVEKFLTEETAEYRSAGLELSHGSVDICVSTDEVVKGEIYIRSREEREIHAFFYSGHYRMQCLTDGFIGREGVLPYQFDSAGLEVDSKVQGAFCILTDGGEYHIPFSVIVKQPLQETSMGKIRNLFHFANLAAENWQEAVDLFYSKEFSYLFVGHDRQYYDLYRGLSAHKGNEHNVEEFLVAIHKKQRTASCVLPESEPPEREKVHVSGKHRPGAEERREKKELLVQLAHAYLNYVTSDGAGEGELKRAEKIVERMNSHYGRNIDGRLYQAHILLSTLRENEAKWVLSHVEGLYNKSGMTDLQYGYYLYLCTLLDDSPAFIRSVKEQLVCLMSDNPEEFSLVCYYIRLMGEELDEMQRWSMYRQQYEKGCRSPILYSEAYGILRESLAYLMELGEFETAILTFAMRYGMYTRETAFRVNELALRKKEMTGKVFSLLQHSYRIFPQDDTLQALCTLMIRSDMRGRECFVWYERAVRRGLRITSLYEYYMMTADVSERKLPPRMLLMYFSYQCTLEDKRKAYYFATLIENCEKIPELFPVYEPFIKEFAIEGLKKGLIDGNAAIIYRYVLDKCEDVELPEDKIRQIAFKHEIEVRKKEAKYVVVVQNRLKKEAVYAIEKGRVYVDCYTPDYVIMLEDEKGNRFCDKEEWTDRRLMSVEKLFMSLEEKGEEDLGFLLYKIYISPENDFSDRALFSVYSRLAANENVEDGFRHEMCRKLMQFYCNQEQRENLQRLLEKCEIEKTTPREMGDIMQCLVFLDKDEQAKKLLYTYGFEQVSPKLMARLIGRELAKPMEFDDRLMALIYYTFSQGKYTQEMLTYLCRYYEGSLKSMKDIFKACVAFDVDATSLAERILQAYLFSHGYLAEIGEVFEYYNCSDRKRSSVVRMYIRYMTAGYFIGQQLPQECVFDALEELLYHDSDVGEVSKTAYLYYMATEVKSYTLRQKQIIQELVWKLVSEKQYVPFLAAFSDFVPWLELYSELTYIEYRTLPGSIVTLNYLLEGREEQYCRETLQEICAGYYCRSFMLFYGERLQYYLMEQRKDETMLTESGYLEKSEMTGAETESRFSLLNDIIMSDSLKDFRTRDELLMSYRKQSLLVEKLFL